MKATVTALMLLVLSLAASAQQKAAATPDFAAMEREWLRAQDEGDVPALAKMYDDDFIGTTFTGKTLTRRDILPEDEGAITPQVRSELESVSGKVYGDTAVVLGQVRAGERRYRFTKVYVKRGSDWKLVTAHLSRVQK